MQDTAGRVQYRSDSSAAWHLLPIAIGLSLIAAVGVAWIMEFLFLVGWYLIVLVPFLCGLAMGGIVVLMVVWSRCRNCWMAAAIGVLVGVVCYLGYYGWGMKNDLPANVPWRLDILPAYIEFRMENDIQQDVGGAHGPQPKKPSAFLNWFTFFWEFAVIVGITGSAGWTWARRAYCVELGRWMRRETAYFALGTEQLFLEALRANSLADFVARVPAGASKQNSCRLVLEHAAPDEGSLLDYPVYASVVRSVAPRNIVISLRNMRGTVLRQVQLQASEVLTLRPFFPQLTQMLALQHAELRDVPAKATTVPPSAAEAPSEFAETWPVPERFRQRVRSKGYALWVNLRGILPLVYIFGGLGCLAGGMWLAQEKGVTLGWILVPFGPPMAVWGFYTGLYCPSVAENRWIDRRLRREISLRPDFLVDPRDAESIYVSLIPRESFVKVKLTMASDLLLLKFDGKERRLVLEGDCDRYTIPRGAISVCEPECFYHPVDHQQRTQIWVMRLVVRFESDMRELLLSANRTQWKPMTNARREKFAGELCRRIKER